ncbi:hypothetical protein NE852_19855 [Rhizobium sp. Pop5]|uniref:hypothetical protein n=1 Tax=Rhizobium sp. Pop5 TaxID=1223565 RepID=UPI000283B27B|nr:hypothetical protein [Rhizobium sp. Pop5]EJZ21180.1 hypothetical protein RCCGEPOP_11329 [Rhizobium sp. Pop5]UVD56297.1 hypothetical protein NE852_19855 [Rhizobium sp. Pop5]
MIFKVIEGGRGQAALANERPGAGCGPSPEDVQREAARRLSESGCHLSRVREFATGVPMPAALKYMSLQIDFVAEALLRLDPIPLDFRSDAYWPVSS